MSSPIERRVRWDLAAFGEALGDPSRAAMVVALMGGVARPASELARAAGVTPSTATAHLQHLVRAGLLVVRAQGRHRYYSLAGEPVARTIESIGALHPRTRGAAHADPLTRARVCYAHLAGRLAIALWSRARDARWITWTEHSVRLLPRGRDALAAQRLVLPAVALAGRPCLDWTERVPHLSGPLGVAVCDAMLARAWLRHREGTRALRITTRGREGLTALGVALGDRA